MSQQKEIGTLVVVVLKAQHLHQPSFYKQDPYAQAALSGLKKRTKVAPKGGQHPVWDDELRFPVLADVGKDKANRILEISCYKDEQRGEDVLLGKGTVDIEETLKTGEFDDWVPLETSAGTRGEIYLEMTFYANTLPPLTRRPSKLSPLDRLARPAQGQQSVQKTPPAASAHPGRSPITTEKKPSPISGSQIPTSLIPARGGKTQGSKQAPLNDGASPAAATVKHRDASLPPLPVSDTFNVGSGRNAGVPAALHPGGRGGPRPIPPQSQSQVIGVGRPPPEIRPEQIHRRTLSDTPTLHVPSPFPQHSYPSATTAVRASVGSTPSILVEEYIPSLRFPTPVTSSPGPAHPAMQSNPQALTPVPTQGYLQTLSPFQPPIPPGSPYIPPGQPQQHYDASPPSSPLPSHYQQYTQYPSRPMTAQPLPPIQMYPQLHSVQSQQHLTQYQPPYSPPLQPPFGSPSQQQHQPQQLPYSQTPRPPQVLHPYQQNDRAVLPLSNQPVVTPQQSLYSQPQPQQPSVPIPPPPPPIQSQTQTPNAYTQTSRQSQPYFSPPPPPPPLYSQGGNEASISPSVVRPSPLPSQGLITPPTSSQQIPPLSPSPQPPATPLPSRVASDTVLAATAKEVVGQSRMEKVNETGSITSAETATVVQEMRESLGGNQTTETQNKDVIVEKQGDAVKDVENRGVHEERDIVQPEEEHYEEELQGIKRQEEGIGQQEEKRNRHEEEEREKREEEERRRREEEFRREEEHRKKVEELERKEEELRKKEEELRKREEEERRRREEEQRRREEELKRREEEERRRREEEQRRREEELRRQEEEELRRKEEEQRRKEEEERKRREEERVRYEREEAECRQKEAEARRRRAEEAEATRRLQEELARIKALAEQEAADAAFARAQMEEEEAERRRQEEEDLALVRRAQEEEEREERVAQERRRQEEADREVARREQAHEEELERRRREERRKRMEKADRELAKKLDMELNLST